MNDKEIINYMNNHFNQDSDDYNFLFGPKNVVIRLDDTTAVSTWDCGAIVCRDTKTFFIDEDDGHWFISERNNGFSSAYMKSFGDAMIALDTYLKENGIPFHYVYNSSYELDIPTFS